MALLDNGKNMISKSVWFQAMFDINCKIGSQRTMLIKILLV